MRNVFGGAIVAIALSGCAQGPISDGVEASTSRPGLPPALLVAPAESALAPIPVPPWGDLVRKEAWAEAAKAIDALADSERSRAEVRYARARVALALGDAKTAVERLADLESAPSDLAAEISELRARAQGEAGPYVEAAAFFERRGDAASLLLAALAREKAGDLGSARRAVDRALGVPKNKDRDLEARIRAVRARIAEASGDRATAVADLRWLATRATGSADADGVDDKLDAISPGSLDRAARIERARDLSKRGLVEALEHEIDRIEKAPGGPLGAGEAAHLRGWALYFARRDLDRAATLLSTASRQNPALREKDSFFAAKALARAPKDAEAILALREFARQNPKSAFAEEARYLSARLLWIAGDWKAAEAAYGDYLRLHGGRRGRGENAAAVEYEIAICRLAGGAPEQAARDLGGLVDREDRAHRSARLRELEGVALAGASKVDEAAGRFRAVAEEAPLSFAAQSAAARLRALGRPAPPVVSAPSDTAPAVPLSVPLPPRARLFESLGFDTDAESTIATVQDGLRTAYPGRETEALCTALGTLSTGRVRYRLARRDILDETFVRAPSPRTRWAWECAHPEPYAGVVREMEAKYGLPAGLVWGVMRQESAFDPDAVSGAGAVGLMQLLPETGRRVAGEVGVPYDVDRLRSPRVNIELGAFYLKKLLDFFGGVPALALAAYNAGPRAVSRWLEGGEALPLDVFVARIPFSETRDYVARVLENYARYRLLAEGEAGVPALALDLPKGLRAPADAY